MIEFHEIEQQSDEWFALKVQHPFSSSRAQAIASAGAGLESVVMEALRDKYSSGISKKFSSEHTDRGNELEPQARAIYELERDVEVKEVGFVTNKVISPLAGASPDGLVGDDGLIEIKSPSDDVYLKKLIDIGSTGKMKIDSAYAWQIQLQLIFTNRKWCDFIIYNPNFEIPLFIERVEADPMMQQKLLTGIKIGEKMYHEKEAIIKKALNIK